LAAIDFEAAARYLKGLAPVAGYVRASEGLVVEARGVSGGEAENLAAWATQLVRRARRELGLGDPAAAVFHSPERDVAVAASGGDSIIVISKPGFGEPLLRAITGEGPRCGRCGADLSWAVILCPRCGARLPFSATHCSECGATLHWRRCPHCGAVVDDGGRPARLRERLLAPAARSLPGGGSRGPRGAHS